MNQTYLNISEEISGHINKRELMKNQQNQDKKPYREVKPKEKRKPDYSDARKQKRGD